MRRSEAIRLYSPSEERRAGSLGASYPWDTPPPSTERASRLRNHRGRIERRRSRLVPHVPEGNDNSVRSSVRGAVRGVLTCSPNGTLRRGMHRLGTIYERMSPSVKHREFVNEPMRDKPVSAIAGIAHKPCEALVDLGYDRAYILFGQFLIYRKEWPFVEWLMKTTGTNIEDACAAYNCLKEWAAAFL